MTNQEAIKDIEENIIPSVGGVSLRMAIEALKELKTGKWIKDIYGNVICSECRANRRDNRIGHIAFCNCCGAKMEQP